MSNFCQQLTASLQEVLDIEKGITRPAKVTRYEIPNVALLIKRLGTTQSEFSSVLSIDPEDLSEWVRKISNPTGLIAKVMLLLQENPSLYEELAEVSKKNNY